MYWMFDERGRGDQGSFCESLHLDKNNEVVYERDARPAVGKAMRVGSSYARTMQHQDWWLTTPITEILSDTPNEVVFKTRSGSIYTWRNK